MAFSHRWLLEMSGGHFLAKNKFFYLEKIQSGKPVEISEKLSNLDSSTTNDLSLIAKVDEPIVPGKPHSSDHNIKVIQIQTGGGNETVEKIVNEDVTKDNDTESSDSSSSSISIDFTNNSLGIKNDLPTEVICDSQENEEKNSKRKNKTEQHLEPPTKRLKTFNFRVIE